MPLKTTEVPAQALRREAGDLLGRIQYQHEHVVITKHGKPIVAMVPIEDLALIESARKKAKFDQNEAVAISPAHIGSDFDDYLREEGIYDEVSTAARKRVAQWMRAQQTRRPITFYEGRARKAGAKTLVEPAEIPAVAEIAKLTRRRTPKRNIQSGAKHGR